MGTKSDLLGRTEFILLKRGCQDGKLKGGIVLHGSN